MPSATRVTTPIIVEVKPDKLAPPTSDFSSSTPPSPKAVRFAPRPSELVTGYSRPLTTTEAWSLYHFECHARKCLTCSDPYTSSLHHNRLCSTGHALAQDVAIHVYHRGDQVYSTRKEDGNFVRVEVPHDYNRTKSLLKSLDYHVRRKPPVVSYEQYSPVAVRYTSPRTSTSREDYSKADVVIEPASSQPPRKHRDSTKYRHLAVQNSSPEVPSSSMDASNTARKTTEERPKRGSLYERDMQRPKKEYRVVIRQPADEDKRRRREERDREERKHRERNDDREEDRRRERRRTRAKESER